MDSIKSVYIIPLIKLFSFFSKVVFFMDTLKTSLSVVDLKYSCIFGGAAAFLHKYCENPPSVTAASVALWSWGKLIRATVSKYGWYDNNLT